MPTITDLLQLPKDIQSDVATVLQTIYTLRYSGAITIHFSNGQPRLVQVAPPEIRLSPSSSTSKFPVAI